MLFRSYCGAMGGLLDPKKVSALPQVAGWLEHARELREWIDGPGAALPELERLNQVTERNVLLQLEHLRAHPAVAEALAEKKVRLMGWMYRIESGEVQIHDEAKKQWVCLTEVARQRMGHDIHTSAMPALRKPGGPITY